MTWRRLKSGLSAVGHDGVVYKVRPDGDDFVVTCSDGEQPAQGEIPWGSEANATWFCEERDRWRA